MLLTKWTDRFLEFLKQLEAKYYHADYAKLRDEYQWNEGDGKKVRTLPVVNTSEARTILIFKPDEIGDAVYALPAIQAIKQALPESRLFLVCQKKAAPIYERSGLFNEIATAEPRTFLRKFHRLSVKAALQQLSIQSFDVGVFLRSYPGYFRHFMKVPCRVRIHPRDPRMKSSSPVQPFVSLWVGRRAHQAVQLCEIVEPLVRRRFSREEISFPPLQFTSHDEKVMPLLFGTDRPRNFFVVHPFADYETRHYPYWNEIIRWLKDRFRQPLVVIGGPKDPILSLPNDIMQTQGRLTLGQTAFLISQSKVFLGNLSGPVHLAGALGKSNVTLMSGHSAPSEWTPFGDALVLRADVGCAPCHLRTCHRYELACVRSLNPLKIMPHLDAFISARLASERPVDQSREILFDT